MSHALFLADAAAPTPRPPAPATQADLNAYYVRLLSPPRAFGRVPDDAEARDFRDFEQAWNRQEEARLDLADLPRTAADFAPWYAALHRLHRARVAPFFEHLAERASLEELAFYISMEEQVDGRFDDVIALAQLGMTGDMKLALAENFWDEMGLGEIEGMHTRMFARSADHMRGFLRGLDVAALVPEEASERFVDIARGLCRQGAQSVVLACTEIPLVIGARDVPVPVIDTVDVHCAAILAAAFDATPATPRSLSCAAPI